MNSKIIAAGVVVALCAVALIGVGYAYTATVTSPDNDFNSSYIVVQAGDGVDTLFTDQIIKYDSQTVVRENVVVVDYTTIAGSWNSSTKTIKVTGTDDFSGQTVTVKKLFGQGATKRRIMDMGITKGVSVTVQKVAPLGDPIELTVRGYQLSLRKADAEMIEVEQS